ncbi:MAG TPA: copper resistance protein CopC [Gemmatimonadaceae bacterium]|nr:copper resistance protein CopC [Gemmatimonadaceae bacterium]
MRSQRFRLVSRALALLALAVLVTPALLLAHAHLVRSDPANDAVVSAPTEMKLWFSERPDLRFSRISLRDSTRNELEVGPLSAIEPMGLRVALLSRLHAGRYFVVWSTAASDGHMTQGTLRFRVRQDTSANAATAPAAAAQAPAAARRAPQRDANALVTPGSPVVMSSAVRWAEFMALLCVIGAIVFRLVILPASRWPEELAADSADRVRRLAVAFAILFAITTLTRALAQSELLAQPTASRFDALRTLVSGTRWGLAWSVGACGIVLAFIGLVAARATRVARAGLAGWIIASVGVVAITISEALTGHSGSSPHLSLAMAADVAHQLGAGGWVGGLACVLVAGLPPTRRLSDTEAPLAGSRLVRAYHASALECVALVVASGILASCLRLHAFSDLWRTPYGSMLFRKLVFVAVVLGFGYFHWRRVVTRDWDSDTRFRFARSVVLELVAAALVVGLTALLVSTQLP